MNLSSLALVIFLLAPLTAYSQSVARASQSSKSESNVAESTTETKDLDRVLAVCAIALLKRLDRDVLVFRSLGDFEADGRLARVPFETYKKDFEEISAQVGPMISRLPHSKVRSEISNAFDSYGDGAFWWQKIYQPRVVHVSALTSTETSRTSSDSAFLATVPYTVAIHWRQASRYLTRAQELMDSSGK
jgi:hypothetical protein